MNLFVSDSICIYVHKFWSLRRAYKSNDNLWTSEISQLGQSWIRRTYGVWIQYMVEKSQSFVFCGFLHHIAFWCWMYVTVFQIKSVSPIPYKLYHRSPWNIPLSTSGWSLQFTASAGKKKNFSWHFVNEKDFFRWKIVGFQCLSVGYRHNARCMPTIMSHNGDPPHGDTWQQQEYHP